MSHLTRTNLLVADNFHVDESWIFCKQFSQLKDNKRVIYGFMFSSHRLAMLLSKENQITFLRKYLFCPKLDSLFPTPLIPMQLDIELTLSIHRVISFVGRKWVSSFPVLERTIFSARNAITPYV